MLRRVGFDGEALAEASVAVVVAARATVSVPIPADVARAHDAARELLIAKAFGTRGSWWFAEPRDSALVHPTLSAVVEPVDEGVVDVTITTDVLVRDLTLLVDRLDPSASVDRGLVTLLPEERATFRISGVRSIPSADDVLRPEIARSGNQLVCHGL